MPLPVPTTELMTRTFGFTTLRDGQEEVVSRLIAGKSALAIFPTGGGKSLCYQLPALHFNGLTLVVSPLIALMKDQLDFLTRKGVAAARLDSSLDDATYFKVIDDLSHGRLKLLYVAPERLANERFQQTLKRLKISMMAVDEAHCISEWGHNFRPDYLKLARLAVDLNVPIVLALTATAPPGVAADIARAFRIAEGDIVRTGFYRPNLRLHVTGVTPEQKLEVLVSRLNEHPRGPTIVYVTLQRTAEEVASKLERHGLPAKAYHAGLDSDLRTTIQDWFMVAPDAIVVATIAFGMGIDKANIRAVYHYNLPKTLENYAQEIGRAGRDGLDARCEMLASESDRIVLENFTYGDTPTAESISALFDKLFSLGEMFDVSPYELSGLYDIRPLVLETIFTYLELDGVMSATGHFYTEYKFQPLRPSKEILAKFDKPRAAFLTKIFQAAKPLKTWYFLDVAALSTATGEPRSRIIAALNYLEEQGDFKLQVAGTRSGFRMLNRPVREPLLQKITARFADRERRDLERFQQVLEYIRQTGCRTRFLGKYFGETETSPCGHCGACLGEKPVELAPYSERPLGPADEQVLRSYRAKRLDALATPRQLTRFLCGLSSPAVTRAKLQKETAFGILADVPFRRVLEWIESRY
jgi:ATP-dependent DNA helicase RecQ